MTTLRAGDLGHAHIGMLIRLPGRLTGEPLRWEDTVAPIIMVTHTRKGVKVRRHPDAHTDHGFDPDDMVTVWTKEESDA